LLALQMLYPETAGAAASAAPTPEQLQCAEMAVLQQADLVRQLKASGMGNSSPEVQQQVQVGSGIACSMSGYKPVVLALNTHIDFLSSS
jgi:hypothetical protein